MTIKFAPTTKRSTEEGTGHELPEFVEGSFLIRFARTEEDVRDVQRLRYRVFNLELEEGLAESHRTGLDRDRFDEVCDHLMVIDLRSERLIGTYRLQAWPRAAARLGYYSADEFDFGAVPDEILHRSIELGRACIEKSFRHGHALFALWRGLAAYAAWTGQRYLLGCCSLTSQDPGDGVRMHRYLERKGYWDEGKQQVMEKEVKERIDAAVAEFEARSDFEPDAPFDHVFGTRHEIVEEQRREFLATLGEE